MNGSRRRFLSVAGTVGVGALGGCVGALSGDDITEVRVASSIHPRPPGASRIVVGLDEGIFESHGLELEVTSFRGGSDVIRSISTGEIDVGLGGLAPVVKAHQSGANVNITGVGIGQSSMEYHARADADFESIDDVAGKTIAVTGPDNSDETTAIQSLRNVDGVSHDDVSFVYAGGIGEISTVLLEGKADLGALVPPLTYTLPEDGKTKRVWTAKEYAPYIPPQVFTMSTGLLDDRPDLATRILEAFVEAGEFVIDNPVESAERWGEENEYESTVAVESLTRLDLERLFNIEPEKPYFYRTGETMVTQGIVDEQPDWEELVRQDPLPDDERVDWL